MINIKKVNIYDMTKEELKTISKESLEEYKTLEASPLSSKIKETNTLDVLSKALQKYSKFDTEAKEIQSNINSLINSHYHERNKKTVLSQFEIYNNLQSNCTSSYLYSNSGALR